MKNRFFTILIIPEKTSDVRRIIVPQWLARTLAVGGVFATILLGVMAFDYWYVMSQIADLRDLKMENRRLQQQVQAFRNRLSTMESTLERIKTFSTRLKIITNTQDHGNLSQLLDQKLPDASKNISVQAVSTLSELSDTGKKTEPTDNTPVERDSSYYELENWVARIERDGALTEQGLQDQYELLVDQKAFLGALPTRKPAVGYFTSGFGVRSSPYGGTYKMHEGLDIANHVGTSIRAPADATVVYADMKPGYGRTLILSHGYGLETWYAHTQRILVKKGTHVKRGDEIAQLGNSGRSTGPHLHYEVRVHGIPVDPLPYILEN